MSRRAVTLKIDEKLENALSGDGFIYVVDLSKSPSPPSPSVELGLTAELFTALKKLGGESGPRLEPVGVKSGETPTRVFVFALSNTEDEGDEDAEAESTADASPMRYGAALARAVARSTMKDVKVGFDRSLEADASFMAAFLNGLRLRRYDFKKHRTGSAAAKPQAVELLLGTETAPAVQAAYDAESHVVEAVHFCRDLVSEPTNHLTTTLFKETIEALASDTLSVEILDEKTLEEKGFRGLLAVGVGSESPSYVAVMRDKRIPSNAPAPLCLIGKGVVFDSGGLSLKPAGSMKDMKMDMGGAAVVVSTMSALSKAQAPSNVIGLVGLVENMPSGKAYRPGDILKMRSGTTVEVVNTDAEGRLVLADVLNYAIETYKPAGLIDLATLTGGMITALGHDIPGVFSNSDILTNALLKSAEASEEELWRMPLKGFHRKLLSSEVADIKQTGGPSASAISAAKFLEAFVDDVPWAHFDIAGVTMTPGEGKYWPKGASGWGVRTLYRFAQEFDIKQLEE